MTRWLKHDEAPTDEEIKKYWPQKSLTHARELLSRPREPCASAQRVRS